MSEVFQSQWVVGALVLFAFYVIFRIALGGGFPRFKLGGIWKRDRRYNIFRPSRDRDYTRGGFLAVMALWGLAELWGQATDVDGGLTSTAYVVTFFAAALYAVNQGLTGAILGAVGTAALIWDRYSESCLGLSAGDNLRFGVIALITVVVLYLLTFVLKPLRIMESVAGSLSLLRRSKSQSRPSVVLVIFGALSLVDLATRPGVFELPQQWNGKTVGLAVLLVAALAGLAVALTMMPNFTLSVLSLGTFVTKLYVDGVLNSCTDTYEWQIRLVQLCAFMLTTWGIGWLVTRKP